MDQVVVSHATVHWAQETLHLLPDHALWWPAEHTLFVADLHLGKAASYRALGQPVPSGSTLDNLRRLTTLIEQHQAQQLVFLGDLLHAAAGRTPDLLSELTRWRARHAKVAITLVRGNHDDRAGDPPPAVQIAVVDEPWLLGPFACCHHPQTHATHFVLAGHDHPVLHLSGPARDRLRLPCFVSDAHQATLPAFGAFTGGHPVHQRAGRSLHAVGGGRVWAVPSLA
jgi:DNA ligase-associated metallophosphoesterase